MRAVVHADTAANRILRTVTPGVFRLTSRRMAMEFEPEEDGKPPRSWIQIARVGRYEGHPQGAFEFTPAVFDKIIENFLATENREVPIDFEHATELPGSEGSIPSLGAPATGFCLELRNAGKAGLFGLIEWLEPGLGYIRAGRYRRFSPAVQFDSIDPVSGKKLGPSLTSGALTNRPFLDGMTRLAA
jgi:phage I-like protein